MPLMNSKPLREARTEKWASEYSGGEGFEIYQILIGLAVAVIASAILWILLSFIGIGIGVFLGYAAAVAPNYLDTHHKHPRSHLKGLVKKHMNQRRTLVLNDKRVPHPPIERETFFVEIIDFPPSTTEDPHG
jgi:hypothetical protein